MRIPAAVLLILTCAACGAEREARDADGEHFLSDQQRALEQSKSAAQALEQAAEERARTTEDVRDR